MAWVPAYLYPRRAKDEIDRRFAEPLDVATLARTALSSHAHFAAASSARTARRPAATCSGAGSSAPPGNWFSLTQRAEVAQGPA